jgi:hypothetical protein
MARAGSETLSDGDAVDLFKAQTHPGSAGTDGPPCAEFTITPAAANPDDLEASVYPLHSNGGVDEWYTLEKGQPNKFFAIGARDRLISRVQLRRKSGGSGSNTATFGATGV